MPDISQFAFPMRVVNDQYATVEQGDIADAVGQVHVLCLTPQGWLTSNTDFGLQDQAHLMGGADEQEIERQITEYVPDALAAVDEAPDALNTALSVVNVRIGTA